MKRLTSKLGPLVVVLLIAVAVYTVIHSRHSNHDGQTAAPKGSVTSSAADQATPSSDPPALEASKASLNDRVKAFAALYFSLSPARSAAEIKQAVTPYATRHFLQTAQFGFGSSEADQDMLREGASRQVTAVSALVGEFTDPNTATGSVTLHVVQYDGDGSVVTSFNYQQPMTWVKQGKTWLIDNAPTT